MNTFVASSIAMLVLAACGPRAASTTPAPPPPADAASVAPEAAPSITRLRFAPWPGSNTHQWGTRFLEIRGEDKQTELRLHDEVSFQGSGMQPHEMPPTRHTCSHWEPAPATLEIPAHVRSAKDCSGAAKPVCDEIRAFLVGSRAPVGEGC